jgi:hypothetical protein
VWLIHLFPDTFYRWNFWLIPIWNGVLSGNIVLVLSSVRTDFYLVSIVSQFFWQRLLGGNFRTGLKCGLCAVPDNLLGTPCWGDACLFRSCKGTFRSQFWQLIRNLITSNTPVSAHPFHLYCVTFTKFPKGLMAVPDKPLCKFFAARILMCTLLLGVLWCIVQVWS